MKELKEAFKVIHEGLNRIEEIIADKVANKATGRFIDNGDNTVTDTKTGLMWIKQHSQLGGDFAKQKMTWDDAIKVCKNLEYADHKDWRLPTREELCSIVDLEKYDPAIDPIFTNTQNDWYWTSTPCAWNQSSAWYVNLYNGLVSNDSKDNDYYVRPVRSSK